MLDTQGLVQAWDMAHSLAARSPRGAVLVLDDIQAIDDWTATARGLWDQDRFEESRLRVMLISPMPVKQPGLTEGMTGRFQVMNIPHWSFSEMAEALGFGVREYVYFGDYPQTAMFIDAHECVRKGSDKQSAAVPEKIRARERAWHAYVHSSIVGCSVHSDTVALAPRGEAGADGAVVLSRLRLFRAGPVLPENARAVQCAG